MSTETSSKGSHEKRSRRTTGRRSRATTERHGSNSGHVGSSEVSNQSSNGQTSNGQTSNGQTSSVHGESTVSLGADLAATLAMTAYGVVIALGFARVFSGWNFFSPLAFVTVMGFGISFVARRLGAPGWIAVIVQVVVLLWLTLELVYGASMRYALPTAQTWDLVENDLAVVRDQFPTTVAPVAFGGGWALLATIGMAITVVMSDAFAFRAEARGEALVPGGVLFVFIAAIAYERLRVPITVLLVFVGVIAVFALRNRDDPARRRILGVGGSQVRTVAALVATAGALALTAGWVGPRLPGATSAPLFDTHRVEGGITNVTSPLVDIRSRLVNQSTQVMFRVESNEPGYWRSTTLPAFDGTTFRLPTRPLERIQGDSGDGGSGVAIRQQVEVAAMTGVLVPAAADPVAASGANELRLNRETSTLVSTVDIGPGDNFTIVSRRAAVTPDELRSATTSHTPDNIFVELPDDFPANVGAIAQEVTAAAPTSYDKMLALQNWFRANFEYSTEVQAGHGTSAIESFLNSRIGYCEQFSAAFAAMARTLNIPSRVAVGFTQGELDQTGRYVVRGKNAHAWPEVWFDGVGWVAFEPTPGRGAPGSEDITGIPSAQDDGPDGPVVTAPARPTPVTTLAPKPTPNRAETNTASTTLPSNNANSSSGAPLAVVWCVIALGFLAALPWLVRRLRSGRNQRRAPVERVGLAWKSAQRSTATAGIDTTPSTTIAEWVDATTASYPVAAQPTRALAEVVERLTFAPANEVDLDRTSSIGTTLVDDCEGWARQIAEITDDDLSTKDRLVKYFTFR